jgi:predicted secreted protein
MQIRSIPAHFLRLSLGVGVLTLGALAVLPSAHAQAVEPLRNVVQLSASGQVEVDQDWLQMNLSATRDGSDAAAVQKQLQQTVDAAMRSLRPQAQGQQMQVRTGSFGVYPRHGNDGKIKGWQGRAEIVVEGNDFARISQAAAQASGMTVSGMGFGLSKEGRQKVQDQAQSQAIEHFKQRASLVAKQFGFSNYTLREVSVNSQDGFYAPRMQRANASPMAAAAKMEMADPVPVEAGKEQVTVNVSGSVQLQ